MRKLLATTAIVAVMAGPALAASETEAKTETEMNAKAEQSAPVQGEAAKDAAFGADNEMRISDYIGRYVYTGEADADGNYEAADPEWDNIGEVSDVILDENGGIAGVLVDVGGFLGLGEHTVMVEMDTLTFVQEANDADDFFLVSSKSKEELESMEEYTETDEMRERRWSNRETEVEQEAEQAAAEVEQETEQAAAEVEQEAEQAEAEIEQETEQAAAEVEQEAEQAEAEIEQETEQTAAEVNAEAEETSSEMNQAASSTEAEYDETKAALTDTGSTEEQEQAKSEEAMPKDEEQAKAEEATDEQQANAEEAEGPKWTEISSDGIEAAELENASVYGEAKDALGEIETLTLTADGKIDKAIINVGGFLGIGEKRIALPFDELKLMREGDEEDGEIRVEVDKSQAELEEMEAYEG